MVDSVNIGVSKVFTNQKKIEVQAVQLQTQTERFSKQTAQWLQLIEGFNQSLKVASFSPQVGAFLRLPTLRFGTHALRCGDQEIGDIESWARTIEADMRQIAANLEYVHRNTAMEEATAAGK